MLTNEETREILKDKNLKEEEICMVTAEMNILADLLLDIFFEQNKPCQG